jgi:hypothetical protein
MSGRTIRFYHPRKELAGIHLKEKQPGFPPTARGKDNSLLSSPQGVGGDPSERKPKMDSRLTMSGMTMRRKIDFSLNRKGREGALRFLG